MVQAVVFICLGLYR